MRLYLAGPMRGIRDFNFPAFVEAANALRMMGHSVFNPAQHDLDRYGVEAFRSEHGDLDDLDADFDLSESMAADLAYICEVSDGVCVLPGWQHSSGAKAEVATADALGKTVVRLVESLAVSGLTGVPFRLEPVTFRVTAEELS